MSYVPPTASAAPGAIPNYLVWSILSTIGSFIVCCLSCLSFPAIITGIVAIVFSSQVNSKLNLGDIEGARRSSKNAKLWNWITTGIVIIAVVIAVIWFITVGPDAYMQYMEQIRQQVEQSS